MMKAARTCLAGLAVLLAAGQGAQAQLRVLDYNITTYFSQLSYSSSADGTGDNRLDYLRTVFGLMPQDGRNGVAKAPDIMLFQEILPGLSQGQTLDRIRDEAVAATGVNYQIADIAAGSGSLRSAALYNPATVQNVSNQSQSFNGVRHTLVSQFRPVGYTSEADVWTLNTHYKAGNAGSYGGWSGPDEEDRARNANGIRSWADANLADANVIYAGDFNIQSSLESGTSTPGNPYTIMLQAGPGQAVDPVQWDGGPDDVWANDTDTDYTPFLSQAGEDGTVSGFNGGGLNDRYDYQLISTKMNDGEGVDYIGPTNPDSPAGEHSYRVLGNAGRFSDPDTMIDQANTGFPVNMKIGGDYLNQYFVDRHGFADDGAQDTEALNHLTWASDHQPLLADYQLPAILEAEAEEVPERVIAGALATVTVNVENGAPVASALAADELDYQIATSGAVSGSATGSDAAGDAAGSAHEFALDTSAAGARSGSLLVTSDGQGIVHQGEASFGVQYDVLDHANGSFASGADDNDKTIDFGSVTEGEGPREIDFDVFNDLGLSGFTADLVITGADGSGDADALFTDLALLDAIVGSGSRTFTASFDASTVGSYSATWTLATADEAIPGSAAGDPLVLTLLGEVTSAGLYGDFNGDDVVSQADIDLLFDAFGTGSGEYDLSGDGFVDGADMDVMIYDILETAYGDANLDQQVDGGDFALLSGNWEASPRGWGRADFNGDDVVDGGDFALLSSHWEFDGTGGGVPEPTTVALLACGTLGLLLGRRRRGGAARPAPALAAVATAALLAAAPAAFAGGGTFRVATYNVDLSQSSQGGLVNVLSSPGDVQAGNAAEVIQRINPDILLLNEFDYDAAGQGIQLFQQNYLGISQNGLSPVSYDYVYNVPPVAGSPTQSAMNTGIQPEDELVEPQYDFDFNNDGSTDGPDDAFGFGQYPGRYGFVILSKRPLRNWNARTFQTFLWRDMPAAELPPDPTDADGNGDTSHWYTQAERDVFRLSSKSHVDLPVDVNGKVIHILASHPTPPAFDWSPSGVDWNKRRNYDEIRLWADYVTPGAGGYISDDQGNAGGLDPAESFVIVGDLNADRDEGDRWSVGGVNAIEQLLDNPYVQDPVPQAPADGGGADPDDTATFVGNMRADYVLPSAELTVAGSQVFWPGSADPQYGATLSSDHRLVYVDVQIEWLLGDVNDDDDVDGADVDSVFAAFGSGNDDYDLDVDADVDQADADFLIRGVLVTEYGDANLDQAVDGGDFAILSANWEAGLRGWETADFTGDGAVNGADFAVLSAHWGFEGPAGEASELPEPATLALLSAGAAGLLRGRNGGRT
jgi:hypothetical protein